MKTSDAVRYMKKLFSDYWCKDLQKKAYFQNVLGKIPETTEDYAQMGVYHTGADRASLNGSEGKGKFRQSGVIIISVFVPTNTKLDTAYEYVQNIMNIYRRPPKDCLINFSDFSFHESNVRYQDVFEIKISINFDYDYHF